MKRIVLLLIISLFLGSNCYASERTPFFKLHARSSEVNQIKDFFSEQLKYANDNEFDKFMDTYDKGYINSDGFNREAYSNLIKDVWDSYDNIEYGFKIKNISVEDDTAIAELMETSTANLTSTPSLNGMLRSEVNSIYYLKKVDGNWKIASDAVLSETTTMLYGDARFLNVKLDVPSQIIADTEYTASLEFVPPKDVIAIASIANDKVQYPQKQTEEVFRKLPDDNILERLFKANNDNVNEYVVASIGLTKADICDLSIKLSLTGYGYVIKRINVIPQNKLIGKKDNEDVGNK